ncbi:hypothetical protein [Nonomuraea sp. NPDC046570]|uniref:hypothetical protein n=1 Tax=Nonomuraea sp. NPDC046570 TaxID=3155255 RepID=UPI0033F4B81F
MPRPWEADPNAALRRRLGKSSQELGHTTASRDCLDIWELSNGDIAIIGRDLTESYRNRLPDGVSLSRDERLVVIPRSQLISAKQDIPDA